MDFDIFKKKSNLGLFGISNDTEEEPVEEVILKEVEEVQELKAYEPENEDLEEIKEDVELETKDESVADILEESVEDTLVFNNAEENLPEEPDNAVVGYVEEDYECRFDGWNNNHYI